MKRLVAGVITGTLVMIAGVVLPAQQAAALPGWPNILRGHIGPLVTTAQYLLRHHGYNIAADGDFGSGTDSATRSFQSSRGLSADGQIGTNTWSRLIVTVRRGAINEAVKGLQTQLNRYGYGLTVDGNFGGNTENAVRSFQGSTGLSIDGVVGPQTWQTLVGGFPGYRPGTHLPLDRGAIPRGEYDDTHHDYPAIDLPARYIPAYAAVSGTARTINDSSCGRGVNIDVGNGVRFTYCHFDSVAVSSGQWVSPGQRIGITGNTGNSTGPHLHFAIKVNGGSRCPQKWLMSVYDGATPPAPSSLPSSGCSH